MRWAARRRTPPIGQTLNPWDTTRIPGGSSGGSAAVVAADEAFAALGSDTGGSIRQPAALCGCVGLKPTYGRVSRFGLVAFASSLDQIGPFTKDRARLRPAAECHLRQDPQDSTSLDEPVPDYTALLGRDLKGVKLGMPKEYFIDGIDPQVEAAVRAAIKHYESLGAEIVEVSLPHTEHAVGVYYIIATAEASANLARFDGVRYGHRAEDPTNLLDQYGRTREEGFGPEVKRRIILGTYVLSSGYYDAYYLRAQKVRTLIRHDFTEAFEKVDAIICPTSPEVAFKVGDRSDDPAQDVSRGHLHHRRQPRRHLRHQPPVRLCQGGRETTPHRPATPRQTFPRSATPANRPRLRAVHRLAQGAARDRL